MANQTAGLYLQCLIGMQCNDFTMIAADQTNIQGIFVLRDDADKLHEVTNSLVMGVIGDPGDAAQFAQFVSKNTQLYKMKNGYPLDTAAVVHFTRKSLAGSLREGKPTMVNMLLAGYNETTGGELYTIDFLASCVKVPYAVHGFGGHVCLGILDKYYSPRLSESEGYEALKSCIQEIHQRLFVNLRNFQVKSISKSGVKVLPVINPATFITGK
ncbi:proteasome subunit beta type-2 [Manduca sexta]|uniref:proteasome subunit beta type-2 n=1 Tax=Manduca sexta TaxID=7130 RepID=UPI00188EB9B6|nr:proteasome subunit beta type-2 [Manduca sexta]